MKVLLFFTRTSSMLIELADTLHLCHSVEVVIISCESSVHWDINEAIDIVNLDSRVNDLLRWKWSILNYWVWKCFGLMSVNNSGFSASNLLPHFLSPHRRFGEQTLRCPWAILNSSLAPYYCAWLAQLPQCQDAPHASHASPEGPVHDAALLPGGKGKSSCRCKGKMASIWGKNLTYFGGNVEIHVFKVLGDKIHID